MPEQQLFLPFLSPSHLPTSHLHNNMDQGGLLHFSLYIVEGLFIVTSMLLIILTILRHSALRILKEYWIILGVCSADCLNGLAAISAALYRIPLILEEKDRELVSRRQCFLTVHNFIWVVAFPLQGITLLIVSCDRFLAVYYPLKYAAYRRSYAINLLIMSYLFCFCILIQGAGSVFLQPREDFDHVLALCLTAYAVHDNVYRTMYGIQVIATFLSILLYAVVLVIYRKRKQRVAQGQNSRRTQQHIRKQRTFTINFAISAGFTFLFFCIPNLVIWLSHLVEYEGFDILVVWAYILNNLNPIINLCILLIRQPDIRRGMKALLVNKTLPPETWLWSRKNSRKKLNIEPKVQRTNPVGREIAIDTV